MPLNYVYTENEVIELHRRALRVFTQLADSVPNEERSILPNLYNSVLNMAAQVKVPNLALPHA